MTRQPIEFRIQGLVMPEDYPVVADHIKESLSQVGHLCIRGNFTAAELTIQTPPESAEGLSKLSFSEWQSQQAARDTRVKEAGLTDDEMEVALLVCAGNSNRQIASLLQFAVETIKNRKRTLYAKTGCQNVLDIRNFFSIEQF